MYNVGNFVIADLQVVNEPWNPSNFAVVAFEPLLEEDVLTYHGYMIANLGEGFHPEMVFYLKPGEPLLYGPCHGMMESADPSFEGHQKWLQDDAGIDYNLHFSVGQKVLHKILAKSIYTDWLVPHREGVLGAFNLNMLPLMDWEETEGVGHKLFLNDESWFDFSEALWDAGIPFWTEWLPNVAKRLDAAIDVDLAEARLQ